MTKRIIEIERSNGDWYADCTWFVKELLSYQTWITLAEVKTRAEADEMKRELTWEPSIKKHNLCGKSERQTPIHMNGSMAANCPKLY